jgi:Protein of unknown function (DUF2637)
MTAFAAAFDDYRATAASSIDRAIRLSTAAAVLAVAGIAAYVSYWHAYAVVRAHGESGITARLVPATIDGLVYASSMIILYAARHRIPVPSLARWLLGLGIAATLTANMAQGWSHGPVGALIAAWPAVSLVGSYELLVWLIRTSGGAGTRATGGASLREYDVLRRGAFRPTRRRWQRATQPGRQRSVRSGLEPDGSASRAAGQSCQHAAWLSGAGNLYRQLRSAGRVPAQRQGRQPALRTQARPDVRANFPPLGTRQDHRGTAITIRIQPCSAPRLNSDL